MIQDYPYYLAGFFILGVESTGFVTWVRQLPDKHYQVMRDGGAALPDCAGAMEEGGQTVL